MKEIEVTQLTEEQFNHELKVQKYIKLLLPRAQELFTAEQEAIESFPQDSQAILDAVFHIQSGCM